MGTLEGDPWGYWEASEPALLRGRAAWPQGRGEQQLASVPRRGVRQDVSFRVT